MSEQPAVQSRPSGEQAASTGPITARTEGLRIGVTGATGYIGTRLVPRLLEAGYPVRCLVRSPRKLADRPWYNDPRVEVVATDLSDGPALTGQLRGCAAVFYLVHSMLSAGGRYADLDRAMARRFAQSAAAAAVSR